MPIDTLITFVFASALLALAPGPDNIFVLTQSALYGRKSGLIITTGLCSGIVFHTSAVALGIAALMQTSAIAFTILKVIGALYLLYLSWQAFKASESNLDVGTSNLKTNGALYRRGLFMNVTNPKVTIFFLAFLPQFTSPDYGNVTLQIALLGVLFILAAFCVLTVIALLAGHIGEWLRNSPRASIIMNKVSGTIFAVLALKLMTSHSSSS